MRSVILISPSDKETESLFEQWKGRTPDIYLLDHYVKMKISGERIYVDFTEEDTDYEEGELQDVNIIKPYFYPICYSDRIIMKYFIENTNFSEGSFMDNDHGEIILVEELRKIEILDFIE